MSQRKTEAYVVITAMCAMLVVQGVFLVFGNQLVRSWDATEYKELFIPLAFLFYALRVAAKTRTA